MIITAIEEKLLLYNLQQVAKKFKLTDGELSAFDEKEACALLNLAEKYSYEPSDESQMKCLLICAILWENKEAHWFGLSPFISRLLIKLGLGTSAKMTGWNKEFNAFDSFGSLIDELFSTMQLMEHEVSIHNVVLILSNFQKRLWDGIDSHARIGVSAPTSAGKSFALVNKAIDILSKKDGKVFFIVPTISLISQVSNDFRKKIKEYGIEDIDIAQTVNDISLFKSSKIVYVLTQERVFSALNHPDADFSNVLLLVIDEIQNIEKVSNENEERAKILFDIIQIFKNDINPEKIVISGPRLQNLNTLVKDWFGDGAISITENLPSVINLTYSFQTGRKKLFFVQYIDSETSQKIEIDDRFQIRDKILKRQKFDEEEFTFLGLIINDNKRDGNIIFSDTTLHANQIALGLSAKLDLNNISSETPSFIDFIESTIHPKYHLIQTAKSGVAYHHSKMSSHIRCLVEKLFINKHLNTIVSTTTLMQGVNLPAKNIFIKSPKVGDGETLTGYEFANLKGRAGRLMQDFVGRAIVINEKSCEKAGIDLGKLQQKELSVGYAKKYQEDKVHIQDALVTNIEANKEQNSDLITYIRNMCIKYPKNVQTRLNEVGIILPANILESSFEHIKNLEVPKQICVNNFYWDPVLLNKLYLSFIAKEWPEIPRNIVGCTEALQKCIIKMAEFAPLYYSRYIPNLEITEFSRNKIFSLCIYAENFGKGQPLKNVINPVNFPIQTGEEIEDRINDVQTKVVYGIPKLLKPLFQINDLINKQSTTSLLSFIEVGGYDPKLRLLIEIGVPRETAIALLQAVYSDNLISSDGKVNEAALKTFFSNVKNSTAISKWHKLIIEDILQ